MLQCQLPDLGLEALEIRLVRHVFRAAKHVGCSRQRLIALERGECHLGLDCHPVIPSSALHHSILWFATFQGVGEPRLPGITLSEFPGPPVTRKP
jgi:hypothetical protein